MAANFENRPDDPNDEINRLLSLKALPLESDCCCCQEATLDVRYVVVECERHIVNLKPIDAEVIRNNFLVDLLRRLNSPFGLGQSLVEFDKEMMPAEHPVDPIFRLPIRICESCSLDLTTNADAEEVLRSSPLYARLLDKYPQASVKFAAA